MAVLFVSYARDNEAEAQRLVKAVEKAGHECWWDRRLLSGEDFAARIERQISECDKLVVLWSQAACGSAWVKDEAALGRDLGKLVPLSIDGSDPPIGFRQFYTVDARDWLRAPHSGLPPALQEALGDVERIDVKRNAQAVSFARTYDGLTLAYGEVGKGPPLVKAANWLNHLEFEWDSPIYRHLLDHLSAKHRLIRYDERGNGMSDWEVGEITFDQLLEDLRTVIDASGVDRFDLFCISQGSPVGIAYAAAQPERVRSLTLLNGFARGWKHGDEEMVARFQAMATLMRSGWGKDDPVFRQIFTGLFFPHLDTTRANWWNDFQRKTASPENAAALLELFGEMDVGHLLEELSVPTIVMHSRGDRTVPYGSGRSMAKAIPGARFVTLESDNHLLLEAEPAWDAFKRHHTQFLDSVVD